ncbi:hypothetical protein SUGI_0423270 [Cryptomeria japonica]|nr:hypothetical protein SUGI_0423270 [Cryptomeria japonica]
MAERVERKEEQSTLGASSRVEVECGKWQSECVKLKTLCESLKMECEKLKSLGEWDNSSGGNEVKEETQAASSRISGEVEIDLTEDVEDDRYAWEEYALIARIIGPKQSREVIRSWVDTKWGRHTIIKFLPKGFFVAIFAENHERDKVLGSKNWYLEKHPVYMQPWKPNFNPMDLAWYDKPTWLRLFNLPIEYWGESNLERIRKSLGTLLEIDEGITKNDLYIYARLQIAAVQKVPDHITLITANGKWRQEVEIEKELNPCYRCGSLLHQGSKCKIYVRKANSRLNKMGKQTWERKDRNAPTTNNVEDPLKMDNTPQNPLQIVPIMMMSNGNDLPQSNGVMQEKEGAGEDIQINEDVEVESLASIHGNDEDELDILDPKCISQSANTLLGRNKGVKGRKSYKHIREEKAKEKGLVNVLDYMKHTKGGCSFLGGK